MIKAIEDYASHLIELKGRMIKSIFAIFITSGFSFYFAKEIFQFLIDPLRKAHLDKPLIYTGLSDMFFVYIKIAIYGGISLALPIILFQIYSFLAPGLYKGEKRILIPYFIASPVLFILGAMMAYFLIMPLAWKFFLSFEITASEGFSAIVFEPRVNEYLSIVISLIMAFGITFQLPLVLTLLVLLGIISSDSLIKKRRIAVVAIFVLAAIITPPDAISQIALAIPLILLYELSVLVSKKIELNNGSN
jgi:sec-independent protein translocase protein TatC